MSVNLHILEEHNEALAVWIHSLQCQSIKPQSALIHVDDHSDFRNPILQNTITGILNRETAFISDFVDREIKIDSFIVPSIYLGLISDIIWVRRGMREPKTTNMYVRSYNGDGKKFILGQTQPDVEPEDLTYFKYTKVSSLLQQNLNLDGTNGVLLDIDLDYFSCCDAPYLENEVFIEITKAEFQEFMRDRYHPLKFVTSYIDAIKSNDKYFYRLNGLPETYPSRRRQTESQIRATIDDLMGMLDNNGIRPDLITVCRSRFSGYTFEDQWKMIEETLIKSLTTLYHLKVSGPEAPIPNYLIQ